MILTSESLEDENSFDQPSKVAPKELALSGVAPKFQHTFPANSVTILKLNPR